MLGDKNLCLNGNRNMAGALSLPSFRSKNIKKL